LPEVDFESCREERYCSASLREKNRSPRRRLQKSDSPDDPHRLLWEGTIEEIERVVKTEEGAGEKGNPEFLLRNLSPSPSLSFFVPSLRAEMRWKTASSGDRLTFSLLSTRILTSDFEHRAAVSRYFKRVRITKWIPEATERERVQRQTANKKKKKKKRKRRLVYHTSFFITKIPREKINIKLRKMEYCPAAILEAQDNVLSPNRTFCFF